MLKDTANNSQTMTQKIRARVESRNIHPARCPRNKSIQRTSKTAFSISRGWLLPTLESQLSTLACTVHSSCPRTQVQSSEVQQTIHSTRASQSPPCPVLLTSSEHMSLPTNALSTMPHLLHRVSVLFVNHVGRRELLFPCSPIKLRIGTVSDSSLN